MKVHFSDLEEFTAEIVRTRTRNGTLEPVLRATKSYQPSKITPAILEVSLLSTFLVRSAGLLQVVSLNCFCGEDYQGIRQDGSKQAEALMARLEAFAGESKLEFCAGVYEPYY